MRSDGCYTENFRFDALLPEKRRQIEYDNWRAEMFERYRGYAHCAEEKLALEPGAPFWIARIDFFFGEQR